jgi:hypothetical protein
LIFHKRNKQTEPFAMQDNSKCFKTIVSPKNVLQAWQHLPMKENLTALALANYGSATKPPAWSSLDPPGFVASG